MTYLELEKEFDQAVIFLSTKTSEVEALPVACILHSIRVGLFLQHQGGSKEVILAGLLHDVVEDTNATPEELDEKFGRRIADLGIAITYDEELASQEGSRDSGLRCKHLGNDALTIKAADLVDNLRFYLSGANLEKFGQLSESLQFFLDASEEELDQTMPWQEIKQQHEAIMAIIMYEDQSGSQ